MHSTLIIGIIIFTGFVFGEIATKIKLPKITGYILAGILLNPSLFHFIPENFMENTSIVTSISLSVITFSVGGTLLYSHIKKLGKAILFITLFEAEFAFLAVVMGLLMVTPLFLHFPDASWLTVFIPVSILVGSLASPTDPSATLAVVHEYKAEGPVSSTIMGVAAFDDALGIINYSVAIAVAGAFILHKSFSFYSSLLTPLIIIGGAIILGIIFGFIFNGITLLIKKETEGAFIVFILALLLLCFGTAALIGVDELLATMTMGIIVVNFNSKREKIFKILERYTEELIFVLFFTLSGMHLNFSVLSTSYMLVLAFVFFRALGKISGTMIGASVSKSSEVIKRYTAGGLIPQGGIVIGLALMIKQNPAFDVISDVIISIIIGATIIHELIGPISAKMALRKAGEIK
ncbi:MAG: cation:proton antiporter [Candidatus Hydrothermarchaeota archaeon]